MNEQRDDLRLANERVDERRILGEMREHSLERDRTREAGGPARRRAMNLRHAADAQPVVDLVGPELVWGYRLRRRAHTTSVLERQLKLRVIEAAVHAELRDVSAVDEAAEALVRVLDLLVGKRIEQVVGADREVHGLRGGIADVGVDEDLRPERLVVRRVVGLEIGSPDVIRTHERREAAGGVAHREKAFL